MTPDRVVEAVDVTTNCHLGLSSGLEQRAPDQFGLQGLEESLDHRIIIAVARPGHRDPDAVLSQLGLILDRTILTYYPRDGSAPHRVLGLPEPCAAPRAPVPCAAGR